MIKEAVQEYYINIFPKNHKVKLVLRFVTGAKKAYLTKGQAKYLRVNKTLIYVCTSYVYIQIKNVAFFGTYKSIWEKKKKTRIVLRGTDTCLDKNKN